MEEPMSSHEKTTVDKSLERSHVPGSGADDGKATDEKSRSMQVINRLKIALIMVPLCLCAMLVGLDNTIIATAVPVITTDFNSLGDIGWYATAYYIGLTCFQPIGGKAYTLFPKRAVFFTFLGIFELGSLVCALAPSSHALIVGRVVAGCGAAGLFAGIMIIMSSIVSPERRPTYISVLIASFGLATVIGPVVGGALTQHVTWRWCFYINLPIGGASALILLLLLRLDHAQAQKLSLGARFAKFDLLGFILFAGGIVMVLLGIQLGGSNALPWRSSRVIGLLVGGIAALLVFAGWSFYRKDSALIPTEILRKRIVSITSLGTLIANGGFLVLVYFLPVWFQAVRGATPTQSGVMYLPTVITNIVTTLLSGAIVRRLGIWNPFLLLGAAVMSISAGLLSSLATTSSDGKWIGYQILLGVGYALFLNMGQVAIQTSLEPAMIPYGTSVLLLSTSASSALFPTIAQVILNNELVKNVKVYAPNVDPQIVVNAGAAGLRSAVSASNISGVVDAYDVAINRVFLIPAVCSAVAFLLFCGLPWTSTRRKTSVATGELDKACDAERGDVADISAPKHGDAK